MVDINAAGLDQTEEMIVKEDGFKVLKVVQDLSVADAADRIFEIFAEFFLLGIPLFDRKIQKEKMSICFTRRKNKIT